MNSHLLVIAATVLATVSLVVLATGQVANFAFYKLSLQWPPSVCNSPGFTCAGSTILTTFTIHGSWPQFENDKPVLPYDPTTNRCTDVTPTNPDDIIESLRQTAALEVYLKRHWPNLKNPDDQNLNIEFWKHEWKRHGMCSDYPNNPYMYFVEAISLATLYDPLRGTKIEPQEDPYPAKMLSEAIKKNLGAYPEIACNKVDGTLQLKEVRICFERDTPPYAIRDCPKKYSIKCSSDSDLIRLTSPYT